MNERGATLVEFLVAMVVFVAAASTISTLFFNAYSGSRQSIERTEAVFLAQEGMEAIRSIRDSDFAQLVVGTHGLALNSQWALAGAYDEVGKFKREIEISQVEDGLKKAEAHVSWDITPQREGSVSLVEYFAEWPEEEEEEEEE